MESNVFNIIDGDAVALTFTAHKEGVIIDDDDSISLIDMTHDEARQLGEWLIEASKL